jgi:hypothetical protein
MSHVLPAVACCCGTDPCGEPCCDPGTTEFSISWSGSFINIFNSCECLDVPNFVCPCTGSAAIFGGQVGRGTITRTEPAPLDPCGVCSITLEAVPLLGIGNYNCPCACQWEDPPGSGNFVSCADNQNPLCGPFEILCGVGGFTYDQSSGCPEFRPEFELKYDASPGGQFGGRWEVVLPIRILLPYRPSTCTNADTTYCHPRWSEVFTPGENGVLFRGPQVMFCADGRVDLRSRVGGYSPHNVVVVQETNQQLEWNPGTVLVS